MSRCDAILNAGNRWIFGEAAAQARVAAAAVVALAIVFPDQFPIALLDYVVAGDLRVGKTAAQDRAGDISKTVEIGGSVGKADIDQSAIRGN